jgi:transposase InsO family protein
MEVSERFACRVTGQHRATQRHQPPSTTPADPDAALRAWLRTYAKQHPRRGFRPAYHDARGEGWQVNHKKIQRLWRDEGLRVPQRRRRKRHGTSTASDTVVADAPNRVWAVDFQFDVTTDGRPIKIVSIVDEHTRECLGGRLSLVTDAAATRRFRHLKFTIKPAPVGTPPLKPLRNNEIARQPDLIVQRPRKVFPARSIVPLIAVVFLPLTVT